MLFDKFVNKYIIVGTIENIMPIHIGGGNDEFDPINVDNAVIKYSNGEPFIPGSSLKGVLRSYLERLINTGFDDNLKACYIVNKPCLNDNDIKIIKNQYTDSKDVAQAIYNKLCDVCKIFGSNYFASKIQIKDMTISKNTRIFLDKRDGVGIDRETETAADGKKYDFEVVSAGSNFDFYMTVDNLEERYNDLLKIIINYLTSGELKIGGKTSAGLGNIQLKNYKIYKIEKNHLKEYLLNGLNEEMRWDNV